LDGVLRQHGIEVIDFGKETIPAKAPGAPLA
jgi:hypothetical protein